jgi:predicted amidohydrolase
MKICLAQIQPVTGNVRANLTKHVAFIRAAISNGAEVIVFPELSLTSYEPNLAADLALEVEDSRLDEFQSLSTTNSIMICVGAPVRLVDGIAIGMIVFHSGQREVYFKKYLHADEVPFFIPGKNLPVMIISGMKTGFGICYELSIPEHSKAAADHGAQLYITSVAKFSNGLDAALPALRDIATKFSMMVCMVNAVGPADGGVCAGKSSVWDASGKLLGQLDDRSEGVLMFDTVNSEVQQWTL